MHGIVFAQVDPVSAGADTLAKVAVSGGPLALLSLAVVGLLWALHNLWGENRTLNASTLAREEAHSRRVEELLLKQAETKEALDAVNAAMTRLADRLPAGGGRP